MTRSHHHTKRATNDDFPLHLLHHQHRHHDHLPDHRRPVPALMRMRAATGASAGAVEAWIHWIHTTITTVATRTKTPVNHYHHHPYSHHSSHNHTTAAGIAALAGNALFAGNFTLPANAAFMRRQRLRWAQPPPPSPSPPANPPTNNSTNPSPLLRRNRDDYDKCGGRRYRGSRSRATTLGRANVLRTGARGGVTGGGGGRRDGAGTQILLSGERKRYGRGRATALAEGATAGDTGRAPDHYSQAEA